MGDCAYCPLCGGSSQNLYGGEGYAYPDGLHRHLESSYNAHRCAIVGLCRENNVRMEQESQELARRTEDATHGGTYQILRCAGNLAIHCETR